MRTRFMLRISQASILAGSLAGCAGVNFYSDAALQTRTGIPIYGSKPYLLVARTESEEKPVEVSVVYLPDYQRIIYADPRSGFGSAKLTLALANGQMTAFGQETDPKIAELVTSFAGLVTARAGAAKTAAEAAQIRAGIAPTAQGAKSSVEVGKAVVEIAADMGRRLQPNSKELDALSDLDLQVVTRAQKALALAGAKLADAANAPQASAQLDVVAAQAKELSKLPAPAGSTKMDAALMIVHRWANQLTAQLDAAQPEQAAQPTFELYEIRQNTSGVSLIPVVAK